MAKKKQLEIVGAERATNKALDALVQPYVEAMYERLELQKTEKIAKGNLLAKMEELGETAYVYQDGEMQYSIELDPETKLKCKRVNLGDDGE